MIKTFLCVAGLVLAAKAVCAEDIHSSSIGGRNIPQNEDRIAGRLSVDNVVGRFVGDTGTFTFSLRLILDSTLPANTANLIAFSHALVVSSPEGAHIGPLQGTLSPEMYQSFGSITTITALSDGVSPDTIAFKTGSIATVPLAPGNYAGAFAVSLLLNRADTGKTICLDSVTVGTTYPWQWRALAIDGTIKPGWGGKFCYTIHFDSTFTPAQQYSADVMFLKASDLDQDNYTDIVYSTSGLASPELGGLWIAYGKPGGTFEDPVRLLGARRTPFVVDFVNADTLADIVAVGGVDGRYLYTLLNQGNRTFSVDSTPYGGPIISAITSGHYNNDPYLDIVLGDGTILYGGGGGFATAQIMQLNADGLNTSDFNNDGYDDLAVAQDDSIAVLRNDGSGGFVRTAAMFVGHSAATIPPTFAIADLDKDGVPDIASVVYLGTDPVQRSVLTVGFGDGACGFKRVFVDTAAGYAVNVQVADVDRDHNLDLVSSCGSDPEERVIVWYGDGAGNFPHASETQYPHLAGNTLAITTGDMDRDGNPDFVTGAYQGSGPVTIMYSTPSDAQVLSDEMVVTGYSGTVAPGEFRRSPKSGNSAVSIEVTNPQDFTISKNTTTVSGAFYWKLDVDQNTLLDERTVDYNLQPGEYTIVARPAPNGVPTDFSVGVGIDGSQQAYVALNSSELSGSAAASNTDSVVYYYRVENIPAISPQSGFPTSNAQPTVDWSGLLPRSTAGQTFEFQLSRYTDFRSYIEDVKSLTEPHHMLGEILDRNAVYYWRVRVVDGAQAGGWTHHYALYISAGCCAGFTGNVDCSPDDRSDIADLSRIIDYLYISYTPLCCTEEADVDGSGNIDAADLTVLIANLYLNPEYRATVNCTH
jgi:hypothetical protein